MKNTKICNIKKKLCMQRKKGVQNGCNNKLYELDKYRRYGVREGVIESVRGGKKKSNPMLLASDNHEIFFK